MQQLSAEEFRDGLAGAIVIGRTKPAACHDNVCARESMLKRRTHFIWRVTDNGLMNYGDAEPVELVGEKEGIRVEPVGRQQF